MSTAEKKAYKAQRKQMKKDVIQLVNSLGTSLSQFRRNFFAAPFEKVIRAVIKGNWSGTEVEMQTRDYENIWIIPDKDKVNIFYSIHFEAHIDQAICRLIKNEMEETMR